MGWECPYCQNKICTLNGIECVPAKGNCVLRGKVEVKSSIPHKKKKRKADNSYLFRDTKIQETEK